jgi:hypothetical protein
MFCIVTVIQVTTKRNIYHTVFFKLLHFWAALLQLLKSSLWKWSQLPTLPTLFMEIHYQTEWNYTHPHYNHHLKIEDPILELHTEATEICGTSLTENKNDFQKFKLRSIISFWIISIEPHNSNIHKHQNLSSKYICYHLFAKRCWWNN